MQHRANNHIPGKLPLWLSVEAFQRGYQRKTRLHAGTLTVEGHVRGKWVCEQCETLSQGPLPAQAIDKGIPTSGLLSHVLVAKSADHLPLLRQEQIFGRM